MKPYGIGNIVYFVGNDLKNYYGLIIRSKYNERTKQLEYSIQWFDEENGRTWHSSWSDQLPNLMIKVI